MGFEKRSYRILAYSLAALFAFVLISALEASPAAAADWFVVPGGSGNENGTSWENAAPSIENVIRDNAADGDTVYVGDGTYYENINVENRVTIVSENGPAVTIIITPNSNDHVFEVLENNVTIAGFTLGGAIGTGKAGVYVGAVENILVENNIIENNRYGISLSNTIDNVTLDNNIVDNSSDTGIRLATSNYNTVSNNTVENSGISGITLNDSDNNTLSNNDVENSGTYGIYVLNSENNTISGGTVENSGSDGIFFSGSENNTVSSITVSYSGGEGVHLSGSGNNTLSNITVDNTGSYGVYLASSDNNTISNPTVRYTYFYGIYLWGSENNTISGGTVENSRTNGISLFNSDNNTISGVSVENSGEDGIQLYSGCDNNTISNNTVENNSDDGIYLYDSDNNTLDNNEVRYNSDVGIYLYYSASTTMDNNVMSSNGSNFVVEGSLLSHFVHDIDNTNTVDAGPILYLTGEENDLVINQDNNVGWLGLVNSDNMRAENLVVEMIGLAFTYNSRVENVLAENSYAGIGLYNSSNNTFSNNTTNSSDCGIYLGVSNNNAISNNTVDNSVGNGIYLYLSSNNTLDNNTVTNSGDNGIYLDSSSNNDISNNTVGTSGAYGIAQLDSTFNTLWGNAYDNIRGFLEISAVAYSNVGSNSATITWTTTESSDSRVEYGQTPAYGLSESISDNVTSHSVDLDDLISSTTFYFRVWSADWENNNTVISAGTSFVTSGLGALSISSGTHQEGVSTSNSSPAFSWGQVGDPDVVSFYYKLEGYDTVYLSTTGTSVSYSGIPDGTYTFKAYAYDAGGSGAEDSYQIIIDTTAPTVETPEGLEALGAIETAEGWELDTTDRALYIEWTVEPGSTVYINEESVPVVEGKFELDVTLVTGPNTFEIRVVDAAGNSTTRVLSVNYTPIPEPEPEVPPAAPTVEPVTPEPVTVPAPEPVVAPAPVQPAPADVLFLAGAIVFLIFSIVAVIYARKE